jgi:hypothetical protein
VLDLQWSEAQQAARHVNRVVTRVVAASMNPRVRQPRGCIGAFGVDEVSDPDQERLWPRRPTPGPITEPWARGGRFAWMVSARPSGPGEPALSRRDIAVLQSGTRCARSATTRRTRTAT